MSAVHDPEIGGAAGPDVRLALPAEPANVALVRQALAGLADAVGVLPPLAADMKIAVTEACTNAVKHAYEEGDPGPLEVTMEVEGSALNVSVRDRGLGFSPLPAEGEATTIGFGLALIASLADAFAFQGGFAGTEVLMTFDLSDGVEHRVAPAGESQLGYDHPLPPPGRVLARVRPGVVGAAVLGRVISLLAARAHFSIDRLSDAQLVSDALAAHSSAHALDGHISLAVAEGERLLDLRVGPLVRGGSERVVQDSELPGLGRLLEHLSDEVVTEPISASPGPEGELLRVRLAERA